MPRKIRLEPGDYGWDYRIVSLEDGREILVQYSWEYPPVASAFGWTPCHPDVTDGTTDCVLCGRSKSWLIQDAQQYLDDHIGDVVEDPGYFDLLDAIDNY